MSKKRGESTAVQTFIQGTQAYRIYSLMIQGKNIYEIAETLGTQEENIRSVIASEKLKMTAAMQNMQEQWISLTWARTEWLLSRIIPVLDKQTEGENLTGPDKNLLKAALEIMKFQKDVLISKDPDNSSPDLVINQTFVGGSQMYQEAMIEMQPSYKEVLIDKEMPKAIASSPEMVRLEELAAQFLPEGAIDVDDNE